MTDVLPCYDKDKCIMCMRCSINCPTNAISIGLLERFKVTEKYGKYRCCS